MYVLVYYDVISPIFNVGIYRIARKFGGIELNLAVGPQITIAKVSIGGLVRDCHTYEILGNFDSYKRRPPNHQI